MLIITTVYVAEVEDPTQDESHEPSWHEVTDLKKTTRHWLSIYEGKNRVMPIDMD